MEPLNVALLGLGNVGRAFAQYIQNEDNIRVRAVADSSGALFIKDPEHLNALLAHKAGGHNILQTATPGVITDIREWLNLFRQENIICLIESLPTNITDGQPALDFLTQALWQGIPVVTVDKGPLAYGFTALQEAAAASNSRFAFTGTTGVAIPDEIRGEAVLEIRGVLNGTTNYILTAMQQQGLSFAAVLTQAQQDGIAEPDPTLDTEGWDTACKILILANATMNAGTTLAEVARIGISEATETAIEAARRSGQRVRLIGRARIARNGEVRVSVAPQAIADDSLFYDINGTSKAAIFRTARREVVAYARSGRDAISQVILDDVRNVTQQ
jgi:homoserine dehydrogenase